MTAWEPRKRLAYQTTEGEDGTFMAVEQSGMPGGDWETEYEAMKEGWDMYLKLANTSRSSAAGPRWSFPR